MLYIGDMSPKKCYFNGKQVKRIYSGDIFVWPNSYMISLDVYPNGYGDVTGGGLYEEGARITVEATPNTGYRFVHWVEDFEPSVSDSGIIGSGEIGKAHIGWEI